MTDSSADAPERVTVTSRELGTILAGLRLVERLREHSGDLVAVQTDGGTHMPLSNAEIDKLCQRLNTSPGFVDDGPDEPDEEDTPDDSYEVTFSYLVPVFVTVENGQVVSVNVGDETPVKDPKFVEGDEDRFERAVAAAEDGQAWPSWQFGW